METLNPVPVPAFELSYNGRAITQDIAPYVISATYTDHLTGEADSLDIELEDTDGRWLDRWYPEKGASLAYRFGYDAAPLISAGSFDIDELELAGPPSTVRIKGLATGVQNAVRIYSDADTVPVVSRDKWHRRFGDSAELEYDRASHTLTVRGGIQKVIVEVGETILLKAGTKVTIDAPEAECTGNLLVKGKLTYQGGMAGSGGAGAAAVITGNVQVEDGNVQVDGNVDASGSIMDGGGNSNHHSH